MAFSLFLSWTFILIGRPQDFFPALVPLRLALVFALLTAAATLVERKKMSFAELIGVKEGKKYLLFYLAMIIGIPFAFYRRIAFEFVFLSYSANVLFFYYMLIHIDSPKKMKNLLLTVTIAILGYSGFSLAEGVFEKGRFSFGTMYDANDLAFFLVSLFPLGLYFISEKEGALKKTIAIGATSAAVLTILLTGSRGGFLGLAAVLFMMVFTRNAGIKPWAKAMLLIVIAITVLLSFQKINMERFTSFKEIGSDYNVQSETGRLAIWKNAVLIIATNPLTGVGADCFPTALSNIGEAQGRRPRWQVTHNAYLQIAAETGLPGLFLFISLIVGTFGNFSKNSKQLSSFSESRDLATMAGLCRLAFVGCLITAVFLTQGYSILFTLFFGFSAVTRRLNERFAAECDRAAPRAGTARWSPAFDTANVP